MQSTTARSLPGFGWRQGSNSRLRETFRWMIFFQSPFRLMCHPVLPLDDEQAFKIRAFWKRAQRSFPEHIDQGLRGMVIQHSRPYPGFTPNLQYFRYVSLSNTGRDCWAAEARSEDQLVAAKKGGRCMRNSSMFKRNKSVPFSSFSSHMIKKVTGRLVISNVCLES